MILIVIHLKYTYIHRIMGTKTISLADDAYDRLKAEKRENESFSDTVRRLTAGVRLADYYGALNNETADEVETIMLERRTERSDARRERAERIVDEFDNSTNRHR
jgi:predicted CopG family antitoxin